MFGKIIGWAIVGAMAFALGFYMVIATAGGVI
jgi:hypothetical protein